MDITDDSETELKGGSETETPGIGCVTQEPARPIGCDAPATGLTLLVGGTLVALELPEPTPFWRSPCIPSALLALDPTAETIGASEAPDIK